MAETKAPEATIRELELQLGLIRREPTTREQLQDVELFVRKLESKVGESTAGISSLSSFCTSACFSSASSVCPNGPPAASATDPETAAVFATLHRRGVEVLGEEGLMDAIIMRSKTTPSVRVFDQT
jgi:hypothetical protein